MDGDKITNPQRITAALPTIKYAIEQSKSFRVSEVAVNILDVMFRGNKAWRSDMGQRGKTERLLEFLWETFLPLSLLCYPLR